MSADPPATEPATEQSLHAGSLGGREVVFQAISHLGPAIGVIVVAPVIASFVGASMPLMILIAMVAVLLTGSCVAMLARKLPSAGGYYTYVSHGIGHRSGFVTSWAYFLYDPLIPTLLIMITGGILQGAISSAVGIDIPWWAITVVLLVFVYAMTVRGVQISANLTMIMGALECLIMIGFGIVAILGTDGASVSMQPFSWPDTGGSLQPVSLAIAFGVLLFTGFESAAPLAEETRHPLRTIPRTIIASIIVVGLVWTFASYSVVAAWQGDATGMASGNSPFFVIANRLSDWAWILLAFALLNSALAGALAGQNAGARVLYALGRAGLLPSALGRIHHRYRTPALALTVIFLLNLAVSLGLGVWLGPLGAFGFIGLFITLGVIVLYVMGNLSVIRLYWKRFRTEFNWFKHLLVPLMGSAILVVGLYFSVVPWPAWPLNLAVAIVAGWMVIGLALAFALGRSKRASLERAAELVFVTSDDDPSDTSQAATVAALDTVRDNR